VQTVCPVNVPMQTSLNLHMCVVKQKETIYGADKLTLIVRIS